MPTVLIILTAIWKFVVMFLLSKFVLIYDFFNYQEINTQLLYKIPFYVRHIIFHVKREKWQWKVLREFQIMEKLRSYERDRKRERERERESRPDQVIVYFLHYIKVTIKGNFDVTFLKKKSVSKFLWPDCNWSF